MKLTSRNGRTIQLTEAGRLLFNYASRLFALETEMEKSMADLKNGYAGHLHLFATNLPAQILMPEWLARFKKKYPSVTVQLSKGNSYAAFKSLLNYSADLAFVAGGWQEPGISFQTVYEDELIFIVPKNHRLAGKEVFLEELIKEPFVYREQGSATRKRLISLCRLKSLDPPKASVQVEGVNESIEAVKAGLGAMLVSAIPAGPFLERGEVSRVYIKTVQLKLPIKLCTRENEKLSPAAGNFIELL